MKKDVKYYAVPDLKKVVCTTQRAASVSMIEALAPAHDWSSARKISMTEAFALKRQGWKVLMWIRSPYIRLASAYSIFGRGNGQGSYTFEEFLKRAMSETNPHWSPAVQLHTYGHELLPNDVHLFENLAVSWERELPGYPLEHLDKTPRRKSFADLLGNPFPKGLHQKILDHWRSDFDIRRTMEQEDEAA